MPTDKKPTKKPAEKHLRKTSALGTLTGKQAGFVKAKLGGASDAEAARAAGYRESIARKPAIITRSPKVERAFRQLLEVAGVTDELLALVIRDGLDATTVHARTRWAKREVLVDFSERREMVELVLKVKGYLVEKHEVRGPTLEQILEGTHEDEQKG